MVLTLAGEWTHGGNVLIVPAVPGGTINVVGNSNGLRTWYAFATALNMESGENITFVSGQSALIKLQSYRETISVPSDAVYFIAIGVSGANDYTPSDISVNSISI